MPEFQYIGRDANGRSVRGRRNALSAEDLAAQLQNEAITPIDITRALKTEATLAKKAWEVPNFFKKKVKADELQMFCRQMYTLLKAGIPIGIGVARLAETTRDKEFSLALQKILITLNQGRNLSIGLKAFPTIFSTFFINIVKIGESTGKLDQVFLYLSEYIELEVDTKKKIKTALRYPLLVLVATLVALLVINAIVIPAFADMFRAFKATLPLPTRILIATSDFLIHYWFIILGIFLFTAFGVYRYVKTPQGNLRWAYLQLKIPIIGWLIHRIILARFTKLYALALRSGIPAVEGIELVGQSTGNSAPLQKSIHLQNLNFWLALTCIDQIVH